MPNKLALRLSVVAPSITLAMNAKAQELRAQGVDVFAFGVGEPDFEPPQHVLEFAKKAIDSGVSKYTAVTGVPALKKAIVEATEKRRGFSCKPENICVGVGAKHVLFNLAVALYEPGDEVIIPAPYWVSYPEQVRIVGATPVIVETTEESGWKMSPAQLQNALTPKTKAIILCTPSNPTGAAYAEGEMKALLDVLANHDCFIIVDEIYADLVYDGFKHASAAAIAPQLQDRIITIDGVSKSFAMTGWRIGWAIAPPHIIKALDLVQGQSTTNPASISQQAAVAALTGPLDDLAAMRATFQKRRDVMVAGLNSVPGIRCRTPVGAFYAFADVRGLYGLSYPKKGPGGKIENDEDVAFWLLEAARVAAVPGGGFGAPGYVRFSYAHAEARIMAAIEAMKAAVQAAKT